mmetsp:Transcript_3887/g.5907  ORF Transcript_3887/g.5907 Transcript_3887/m.5907 type:complete len:125 (-) Transcript_3887:1178-1552(-)
MTDVEEITSNNDDIVPEEELKHRDAIEAQKKEYKMNFHKLRELKGSIEHIQRLMEKSGKRIQSDFDVWYREMCGEKQESVGAYARMASSSSSSLEVKKGAITPLLGIKRLMKISLRFTKQRRHF